MFVWIVYVSFLWSAVYAIGSSHYESNRVGYPLKECGEHGRFEYCIDNIPGCVIGCHCHPGYYFDTETKICEPNAKLVHEYRRLYEPEPKQTPDVNVERETTTTTETINKETDELGNWLYNQFFKTIENEVINKTEDSPKLPTRRSGHYPDPPVVRRSGRRSGRRKSRKKKKSLKKKLLRIAKDDSSDDDSSSASASSSSSSSSSSDTSSDTDSSEEAQPKKNMSIELPKTRPNHKDRNDEEHSHRKIVAINHKPKPPLPSFIFLPNYETPFYPPMGLAPPPPMPLYPMVPVPPMVAFPGMPQPPSTNPNCTQSPAVPPDATPPPTPPPSLPTESQTPQPPGSSSTDTPTNPGENNQIGRRGRHRNAMRSQFPNFQPHHRRSGLSDEAPWGDLINPDMTKPPVLNEVNFKYLTQLIHKARASAIEQPIQNAHARTTINEVTDHKNMKSPRLLQDDPEQSYYSDLGQKIASLIRKVEETTRNYSEMPTQNTENVPMNSNSVLQTQNMHSPRSYWERFVRSPLPFNWRREIPPDNDDNLFDIESEVKSIAIHEKPKSLGELENALLLMNKARSQDNIENKEGIHSYATDRNYSLYRNTLYNDNKHTMAHSKDTKLLSHDKKIKDTRVYNYYTGDLSNVNRIKENRQSGYDQDSNRSWNVNLLKTVESRYKNSLSSKQVSDNPEKHVYQQHHNQHVNNKQKDSENPYRTVEKEKFTYPIELSKNYSSTLASYLNGYNSFPESIIQNIRNLVKGNIIANNNTLENRMNDQNLKYNDNDKTNNENIFATNTNNMKQPTNLRQDLEYNANENIHYRRNTFADRLNDMDLPTKLRITSTIGGIGLVEPTNQLEGWVAYPQPVNQDFRLRKASLIQGMKTFRQYPEMPILNRRKYPVFFSTDDNINQYVQSLTPVMRIHNSPRSYFQYQSNNFDDMH